MKAILPSLEGYAHKQSALEIIIRNEVALIWEAYHRLYRRSPKEAAAQKDREIEELLEWRDYMEWKISCENSGISRRRLEEPKGECMPRTRRRWTEKMRETLKENDPFIEFLIGFMIGVMLSTFSSQLFDVMSSRDKLVAEMKSRLKPLPISSSGDANSITRERDKFKPR